MGKRRQRYNLSWASGDGQRKNVLGPIGKRIVADDSQVNLVAVNELIAGVCTVGALRDLERFLAQAP